MEDNHHDDDLQSSSDDTLLARWLAGDLSPEDLEALRNLEGYPDYVEMLHALEGMEMPEFSPTLAWQKLQKAVSSSAAEEVGSSTVGSGQSEAEVGDSAEASTTAKEVGPEYSGTVGSPSPEHSGGQSGAEVGDSAEASTTAEEVGSSAVGSPSPEHSGGQSELGKTTSADIPATPIAEQQKTPPPAPVAEQGKLDFNTPKPTQNQPVVSPPKLIPMKPNWQRWAAIAAAVLIGVVGLWWMTRDGNGRVFGEDQRIATKAGEQREVKLPDGSTAMLNALSTLEFSPKTWDDDRYVLLEGEAFFKAKKGKTFSVRTEQGTVEVVGTVFNVYARGEELEVKCAEGRVQVINPESTERVLLKKGEQVAVLRGRMQDRHGLEGYPNWFKGESSFRSASLERVFGELERQYGVKVVADSLGQRTFSGKFVNGDLQKAVKMVCAPMKLNCEVRGDTVFVH